MKQTQNSLPEWYWKYGLHDANIISATKKESGWNPTDNCLILKIDCDGALFEADIIEIRFYNYKIKTSDFGIIFFWICWIFLTGGAVCGFYYIDNRWLEDNNKKRYY